MNDCRPKQKMPWYRTWYKKNPEAADNLILFWVSGVILDLIFGQGDGIKAAGMFYTQSQILQIRDDELQ
jgi:hypothetical protein